VAQVRDRATTVRTSARGSRSGPATYTPVRLAHRATPRAAPDPGSWTPRAAARLALALSLLVLSPCLTGCKKSGPVYEMTAESSATRYLAEFSRSVRESERETGAPDGTAVVSLQTHGFPLIGLDACHTYWLTMKSTGQRRKLISLREADPGSGVSFGSSWSQDSNAVFLWGAHSGLGCSRGGVVQLCLIYTVDDGKLWGVEVPVCHNGLAVP